MWSCFSFALSISGLYATIMTTFSYPLYAGGAASVTWCWLIGGAGALSLALSIAEISSAYPTSGALDSKPESGLHLALYVSFERPSF
jgi:amino acid transporter